MDFYSDAYDKVVHPIEEQTDMFNIDNPTP